MPKTMPSYVHHAYLPGQGNRSPSFWNCRAKESETRLRVIVTGDVFESDTGPVVADRRHLFETIDATPNLDWLLLTKRPENVLKMTYDHWCPKVPGHVSQNDGDGRRWAFPSNVWLGTSVENQQTADERIPHLLKVPSAVRFLSMEPLLGPVDLLPYLSCMECRGKTWDRIEGYDIPCPACGGNFTGINWVIVGGESGPGARPMHPDWVRSIRDQCHESGVAFWFDCWGEHRDYGCALPESPLYQAGLKAFVKRGGHILDGRTWDEIPKGGAE